VCGKIVAGSLSRGEGERRKHEPLWAGAICLGAEELRVTRETRAVLLQLAERVFERSNFSRSEGARGRPAGGLGALY
jgi:hypothetical protein